jgi:hypothetical protein
MASMFKECRRATGRRAMEAADERCGAVQVHVCGEEVVERCEV